MSSVTLQHAKAGSRGIQQHKFNKINNKYIYTSFVEIKKISKVFCEKKFDKLILCGIFIYNYCLIFFSSCSGSIFSCQRFGINVIKFIFQSE